MSAYIVEPYRYHFVEINTDIFKKIFTDIWPVANIRLATDTDIPKFAYRYNFNEAFGLKLM